MYENMSLVELKEQERALGIEVRKFEVDVENVIHSWIESIGGIKVRLSRGNLRAYGGSLRKQGTSKVTLEYVDIHLVDENDESVFGADVTLSWYGDYITINSGSCGEFVVLGEQRKHDKYQVLKYKLLGILMQYAEELNELLGRFNYDIIIEHHNLRATIGQLEWEEKQLQIATERRVILDSIQVGNSYFDHGQNNKKTVTKITDKRIYFDITYSFSSGYKVSNKFTSKEDFIYNVKHNIYEAIQYV